MSKRYLAPAAILRGESAARAIEAGRALSLDRGGAAALFASFERAGERVVERVIGLEEIREAGLAEAAERLCAPPSWPASLGPRPERVGVLGVLNVTPDSFSDGGRFLDLETALARAGAMIDEGADWIDVGGESTRPGADPTPVELEIARTRPVIEALSGRGARCSIDSRNAATMAAAIEAGAVMINDVTALRHDPAALELAARSGVAVCLMHSQGDPKTMQDAPRYVRACLDVYDHLEARIEAFVAAGGDRADAVTDPGVGFGKTLEHNLDLFRHLGLFAALGAPVLLGASRKSFVSKIAADGAPADRRAGGSIAAAIAGAERGAAIVRVHDVFETRQALAVAERLA